MHFIIHFLCGLSIVVGFVIFYSLNFNKKIALMLIFFLTGLGIGMHEHLSQDAITYSTDSYMHNVVYVGKHDAMAFKEALCLIIYNDGKICKKYRKVDENGND